jgi:hypothetical protein
MTTARADTRGARWSLVALAVIALIGAGCSKGAADPSTSGGTNGTTANEQAVKFSECMRSHGVGAFPDPDASGALTLDGIANGSSIDPNAPAFTQALDACKDLEPPGFTGHKRNAQEQEQALRFAQCIRDNGVKDFPDPTPDGPLIDTNRIPSSNGKGGLTTLNAAMKKCHDIIADQLTGP